MNSEPRNMDLWIKKTLHDWAEQGNLAPEKSARLQAAIAELAHQERRNRIIRTAYGLAATIIAYLCLLFANCPVAAAAYLADPLPASPALQVQAIIPACILICFCLTQRFQFQRSIRILEVNYE